LATLTLLLWIVIAPIFFARMPASRAVIWATLLPYLFLPEAHSIDLSGIPDIDKTASISLGLALGYLIYLIQTDVRNEKEQVAPRTRWFGWLIGGLILVIAFSTVVSVLNNPETLQYGPRSLPGMRPWDGVGRIGELVLLLVPFYFAIKFLASPEAHRVLLMAFVVSGLFYAGLMLIEIRLSPQIHRWVYGFHQHSFAQHVRDGYRPKVLLEHGLWVGFYMFMVVMAATALWKGMKDSKWLWAGVWMFGVLLISRNLGAAAIAILFLTIFLLTRAGTQIKVAAVVATSILVYPALRQSHIVPLQQILDMAAAISEDRSDSLRYRLDNEDDILERVAIKPLTGWGGYARERVYDPVSGGSMTVNEGLWLLTLGSQGWLGYIGFFGILTAPVICLAFMRCRKAAGPETVCLTLICAGNLIYLIPNATLTPIGLLVFGALTGYLRYNAVNTFVIAEPDSEVRPQVRHTRFAHRFPPVEETVRNKS